jgi:cold shock CspA family protein
MWSQERGFGFIRDDDGMPDIFMHITALLNGGIDPYELKVGDHLQYDRGEDRNGRHAAINVGWAD